MAKLKFEQLFSGVRITTDERIGSLGYDVPYKDMPEPFRKNYWFFVKGTNLRIDGENTAKVRLPNDTITEDISFGQDLIDTSVAFMKYDDSITAWVYSCRPDLWAELVNCFGTEGVWSTYIRWNH